jgi:hypothetical protein
MANIVERISRSTSRRDTDNIDINIGTGEHGCHEEDSHRIPHQRESRIHWPPQAGATAAGGFIKRRHDSPAKVEVIGDYIVMLGELIREPVFDGNYLVIDITTQTQKLVKLDHANSAWYVHEIGSSVRRTLADFNQRYYRWVHLHPLTKDVMNEVSRIYNSTKPA